MSWDGRTALARRRTFSMSWPKGTREVPAAAAEAPTRPSERKGVPATVEKTTRGEASDDAAREIERRRGAVRASVEAMGVDPRVQVLKQDANALITAAAKRMVEAHGIGVETALLTLMAQTVSQLNSRRGDLFKYELLNNLKDTPLGDRINRAGKRPGKR